MNTVRILRSCLASAAIAATCATLSAADNRIAFPDNSTPALAGSRDFSDLKVAIGERRESVVAKIGQPDFRLTPNGWVYTNVSVTLAGVTKPQMRNLVIVFFDDKVASIRVASDEIVEVLVADVQRGEPGAAVAATAQ